jgi:nucleoid-associated protein YgaU
MVLRPLLLLVPVAGLTALVAHATHDLRHPATSTYADLLVALAAWVLLAGAVWAGAVCAAAALEATSGGQVRATTWVATPPVVRRTLLAALGVALVGAGPAAASSTLAAGPGPTSRTALPVPARPVDGDRRDRVVVRPGDTLWALAADRLPRSAGAAQVLEAVEVLHRANREQIGPDPDVLRPGQRLVVPDLPRLTLDGEPRPTPSEEDR